MTWSFSIGRLFGSELRVHVTFFLLLAWVGFAAYTESGWTGAINNLLFVLALFACVVAHEFGHALTARRFGIRTPDITLLPIGGLARLERMPENPRQEIIVALAGPAVNIVIWLALVLLLGAAPVFYPDGGGDLSGSGLLGQLATVNLFLALFNLLPAFPMDGGRVFRAVLCLFTDRVTATRAAAISGQVLAFGLGFWGLSSGNPILILIAVFVFVAAGAESQDVAMRAATRRLVARDAMITRFESLSPQDSVAAAAQALIRTTQHEFPVLDAKGHPLGFLTRSALFSVLTSDSNRTSPVSEIMETNIPDVPLGAGLETVLNALHDGAPAVAICDSEGRMLGYVTRENVGELMVVRGR